VLGVDNDPQVCDLCNPLLSSIALSVREAGFEVARVLEALIKGKLRSTAEIMVKPVGVTIRQSTDVLAIEDEEVVNALRFIHDSLPDIISVDDVADATTLSRRALEVRFRKALNISIAEEICRVRTDNAKKLLLETDYSIARIAEMSGYSSTPYFSDRFRKTTGHSPSNYRNSHRTH
jgi:LacI family transcriptional regulator